MRLRAHLNKTFVRFNLSKSLSSIPHPSLPRAISFYTMLGPSARTLSSSVLLTFYLVFQLGASVIHAQLTGRVGPTTSLQSKQVRVCNVLDYGGTIGSDVRFHLATRMMSSYLHLKIGHRPCYRSRLHFVCQIQPGFNIVFACWELQHEDVADPLWSETMGFPDGWCDYADEYYQWTYDRYTKRG